MKQFIDWLDNRTGFRDLIKEVLYENIPGGSRWRYVWGSTLMFALMVQFITGVVLWMAYSPSTQTAWESVYYIQYEMTGGWFLRGIHHWMAQIMTILLVLHLMQVVIDGAYKAPREVNFWFGIGLLMLVLGLSLTGYLLPWDQKGYWATSVATDIMASTPFIGEWLKQIVIGGHDYGHHTLTRFFALHAGVLPGAVIALTAGHIYLFRRHGVKAKEPHRTKDEFFWPEQVLKDGVACLAVLAVVLFFVIREHGAHLDAPADPSSSYQARPDWYFLSLFELLKYVPEFVGAFLIPGVVMTLIILMPMIGKWELGHRFNLGLLMAVIMGAGVLTMMSLNQDKNDPKYLTDVARSTREATLVKRLAHDQGIPPSGALVLLSGPKLFAQHCASCHTYDGHDGLGNIDEYIKIEYTIPRLLARIADDNNSTVKKILQANELKIGKVELGTKLQLPGSGATTVVQIDKGNKNKLVPRLLEIIAKGKNIAAKEITNWNLKLGVKEIRYGEIVKAQIGYSRTAPDLKGFASREWLKGFFDPEQFASKKYFGGTSHINEGDMVDVVEKVADEEDLTKIIAVLSAEAKLRSQKAIDKRDREMIEEGRELLEEKPFRCTRCHNYAPNEELSFEEHEDMDGPDLTGYGSREWLLGFLDDPAHARFYAEGNDRMPAYGKDEKLTRKQLESIIDWLREE